METSRVKLRRILNEDINKEATEGNIGKIDSKSHYCSVGT